MQLVGEFNGMKELDGIGTDVDAGAELGELGRLLVDLHFEALPAQRDGRGESAEACSDDGDATRVSHVMLRRWTLDGNARSRHPWPPRSDMRSVRPEGYRLALMPRLSAAVAIWERWTSM